MGQASTSQRIHSLDGLRGVACLAVLLLHIAMMLELWGPDGTYPLIPGTPAVIVFFVLSGVVLSIAPLERLRAGRAYDWLGYYPRRVVRLGIPLAVAVALGIAAGYAAWCMGSTGRSATAVAFSGTPQQVVHDALMQFDVLFFVSDDTQNLFGDPLVRVNSPVWSMGWELWFSLTLPLAVACLARVRKDGAAKTEKPAGLFPAPVRLDVDAPDVVRGRFYAPLFQLMEKGCNALKILQNGLVNMYILYILVTLVALLGAIELAQAAQAGLLGPLDALALAALQTLMNAACAGLVALAMTDGLVRRVLSTRPARFLGTVSFSLYLTHSLVIGGLEVVLPAIGVTDGLAQACVAVVSCLVCAAVFRRLVERPAIDLSRRVGNALGEAA
mgnify:CR=1 FL=1